MGEARIITFTCVLLRYGIEISNTVGRTKGHINLIVHQSPDESHAIIEESALKSAHIKTNAVKREEFGEYVARMHALNNKGFIYQYQVYSICFIMMHNDTGINLKVPKLLYMCSIYYAYKLENYLPNMYDDFLHLYMFLKRH